MHAYKHKIDSTVQLMPTVDFFLLVSPIYIPNKLVNKVLPNLTISHDI